MKLKCRIHEQDYDIVSGATFSEEYNETLESGSIVLDHIGHIDNLKPYNDVYIWNSDDEFNGYYNIGDYLNAIDQAHITFSYSIETEENTAYVERNGSLIVEEREENIYIHGKNIDLWLYMMLLNEDTYPRFNLLPINLNLVLEDLQVGGNHPATDYMLPTNRADIDLVNHTLILRKNDAYSPAPDAIVVGFAYAYSEFDNYLVPERRIEGGIFLDYNAKYISSYTASGNVQTTLNGSDFTKDPVEDEWDSGLVYMPQFSFDSAEYDVTITGGSFSGQIPFDIGVDYQVSKEDNCIIFRGTTSQDPTGKTEQVTIYYTYTATDTYRIYRVMNGGIITYEENRADTVGSFTITGVSKKQLLTLDNISLNGFIKGRIYKMNLSSAEEDGDDVILYFKPENNLKVSTNNPDIYNEIECCLEIRLSSVNNTDWNGNFSTILRRYPETEYGIGDLDNGISEMDGFSYYFDKIDFNFEEARVQVVQRQQNLPKFFKHLLVGSFSAEMVDLDRENFKYKFHLVSETKGLEKIILPNRSITQPIAQGVKKRTIREYMEQYVNFYSPKIKKSIGNGKWAYVPKYSLDLREPDDIDPNDPLLGTPLSAIFTDDLYAPETAFSAPNLKEFLSKLMITKDCIPVVRNDVIYAMNISKTNGTYIADNQHINFINESLDASSYSTALRREHEGAISQKNTAHRVEYMGFRNSSDALLTLENMEIETQFPIYKINKMYMCYYRKVHLAKTSDPTDTYDKIIFVKQDISDLILQNTVRNTLAADWTQYPSQVQTYNDMKKYRVLTLGYDIGSTKITGWGTVYTYLKDFLGIMSEKDTYIENIMNLMDQFFPFGVNRTQFLGEDEFVTSYGSWRQDIVSPFKDTIDVQNIAVQLKSLVFQVDYNAMYSGTVVHTKENDDEDYFTTTDNSSSSLSVLEVDGSYQKEKINRLGNPSISWSGRYDSYDQMNDTYNNILGSEFNYVDKKVIVYHREYQIYDDCVLCNFVGAEDYILKNYFTTVFAKYRTYSYASYNESVMRKENDRYNVVLSLDNQIYEDTSVENEPIYQLVSAFSASSVNEKLEIVNLNQINGGYIDFTTGDRYAVDVNNFACGYSICFNSKLYDPLTAGLRIAEINCTYVDDNQLYHYLGSSQEWYVMPVESTADGFLKNIGFYFAKYDNSSIEAIRPGNVSGNTLYEQFKYLPFKGKNPMYRFGKRYDFCKDNKEIIDFTLQYEFINGNKKDILFSSWLARLSDFGNYAKLAEDTYIPAYTDIGIKAKFYIGDIWRFWMPAFYYYQWGQVWGQKVLFRIDNTVNLNDILNKNISSLLTAPFTSTKIPAFESLVGFLGTTTVTWWLRPLEITAYTANSITMRIEQKTQVANIWYNITTTGKFLYEYKEITLTKIASGEAGYDDYVFENNETLFTYPDDHLFDMGAHSGFVLPTDANWNANLDDTNSNMITLTFQNSENQFAYPKTMYVIVSEKPLEESLIYDSYNKDNLPSYMHIISAKVPEVFDINELGERPYIQFNALPELGNNYQSVQYWYLDSNVSGYGNSNEQEDDEGNPYINSLEGDGLLHFVFGINRTREEGDAKIYVSTMKYRSKKVYNELHRVIGEVTNCVDNPEDYGTQTYQEYEEED